MTGFTRRDALRLAATGAAAIVAIPLAIVGGTALPALPEPVDENFGGGDWPKGWRSFRPVGTPIPDGWEWVDHGEGPCTQTYADGTVNMVIRKL